MMPSPGALLHQVNHHWCRGHHYSTIFKHGFEGGDFGHDPETCHTWTGISTSTGETATVVTTDPHHGIYHARFTSDASDSVENAIVYKDITASAIIYSRAYFKLITTPPDHLDYVILITHYGVTGAIFITRLEIYNSAGTLYWRLRYHDGASHLTALSLTPVIKTNQWYSLELYSKIDATNGEAILYVDDTAVISKTGLDTDEHGNIDRVEVGLRCYNLDAHDIYADCVVVADTYIGPEVPPPVAGAKALIGGLYLVFPA